MGRVATGEHWYGTRALDLGLVDGLQTSDDYLLSMRDKAEIFAVDSSTPRPWLQRMLGASGWQSALADSWWKRGRDPLF